MDGELGSGGEVWWMRTGLRLGAGGEIGGIGDFGWDGRGRNRRWMGDGWMGELAR